MKSLFRIKSIWLMIILMVSISPLLLKIILTNPTIGSKAAVIKITVFILITALCFLYLFKFNFPKKGSWLVFGFLFLEIGPILTQKFGYVADYDYELFTLFSFFILVYLIPPLRTEEFIKISKNFLLIIYVYGSLFFWIISPAWVLDITYSQGLIAGFDIRFSGLTSHGNSLGPLIGVYLILDMYLPSKFPWRILHNFFALFILLLTQSKTVWVLVVISYLVYVIYNKLLWKKGREKLLAISITSLIIAFTFLVLLLFNIPHQLELFIVKNNIMEFTGRRIIWEITMQSWMLNPLFGYGLELWGPEMQQRYLDILKFAPGTAHNQLMQSLGESGIIGLLGLVFYTFIFLRYSIKYAKQTKGITIILFIFIYIRGVTEVSFPNNIYNVANNVHFIAFSLLILLEKQDYFKRTSKTVSAKSL
ncbi:O-antigen ligase family protein [Peribacillus simplex]|uniref:O-antigen ligase family protein n=1 Tax=Peribacillus simplex TaxID=1478 RepID=UPI00367318CC